MNKSIFAEFNDQAGCGDFTDWHGKQAVSAGAGEGQGGAGQIAGFAVKQQPLLVECSAVTEKIWHFFHAVSTKLPGLTELP